MRYISNVYTDSDSANRIPGSPPLAGAVYRLVPPSYYRLYSDALVTRAPHHVLVVIMKIASVMCVGEADDCALVRSPISDASNMGKIR